ncbi:Unknown protein sequence [Pseudomonas syringae pv. cilantro]|uniref:Uncharacterized protein n=1 Tax=Pseudomonas syringae pv. cilantro TaxID=81035 RepID=A0A0N0GI37_PSESX|nr:Unknown protein sequence [Pseudomonas syringae pv. cilantro]
MTLRVFRQPVSRLLYDDSNARARLCSRRSALKSGEGECVMVKLIIGPWPLMFI